MRERMVQHRANPVCASCHVVMDPLGLALENFDAVGRWRDRSEAGTPIDASGALPDGTTFEGVAGLRGGPAGPVRICSSPRHREAPDLCARPWARVLRRAGRSRDHDVERPDTTTGLGADPGHRQQHAVSDEENPVMIISKMALPRRTFLRGMGVTLALPLLDAMVPALTARPRPRPAQCAGSGSSTSRTAPPPASGSRRASGTNFELSPSLQPLEPVRQHVVIPTGLDHRQAEAVRRRQRGTFARHRRF